MESGLHAESTLMGIADDLRFANATLLLNRIEMASSYLSLAQTLELPRCREHSYECALGTIDLVLRYLPAIEDPTLVTNLEENLTCLAQQLVSQVQDAGEPLLPEAITTKISPWTFAV